MTEIKVGDRVRYWQEGMVTRVGRSTVDVDYGDGDERDVILKSACEVVVPPIAVGDVVTAENIAQLPAWSVIAFSDGPSWTRDDDGLWNGWLSQALTDIGLLSADAKAATVLRIGGAS